MECLAEMGAVIQVVTSGNGSWYFRDQPEVQRVLDVEQMNYGARNGKLSVGRTLLHVPAFIALLRRNGAKLESVLNEFRPDVVVADSVYTLWPIRKKNIRLVGLNNADVVNSVYAMFPDRPRSVMAQFYCVEKLDYLFHRWVHDLIISPSLDADLPVAMTKIRRVGPIVRRLAAPVAAPARRGRPRRLLIMLSGSSFGRPVVLRNAYPQMEIDIVGRQAPAGDVPGNVRYHGRVLDDADLIRRADIAVVNGGFSAVSEMFCLKVPVIVLPVPNHAEQWANARVVAHLGVGMMAAQEDFESGVNHCLEHIDVMRDAYDRLPPIPNGASQAAAAISGVIGRPRVS